MRYCKLHLIPYIYDGTFATSFFAVVYLAKALHRHCVLLWQPNIGLQITVGLTEVIIVDAGNISDRRIWPTRYTLRILASDPDIPKLHGQAIKDDHSLRQNLTLPKAQDNLDNLQRLDLPNQPRHHAKHASIRAVGHSFWRRWIGKEASVAWTAQEIVHSDLALPSKSTARDQYLACPDASITD